MSDNLIGIERLQSANKILFIAHLALGDFTYLQNCFAAFHKAFPQIEMHLWVDEVRRTADASQWPQLKNYSLYDWVQACPFFKKVYTRSYSPALFEESIIEAREQRYPLVVSLATLRPHQYARLARRISPDGFVAGLQAPAKISNLVHFADYRKLDAVLVTNALPRDPNGHISDVYADWFQQLFGLQIPAVERLPYVHVPQEWSAAARQALAEMGVVRGQGQLVFINTFAKTKKRCWPLSHAQALIQAMRATEQWRDAFFLVNAMPHERASVERVFAGQSMERIRCFSADKNFFQLPAMLAECDLIISVETAVMHLANAVHVPVIALMRQKSPEWVPVNKALSTVIMAARRRDWVKAITVEQVMQALPKPS
jgi:ADP-heptose:LPS heptosyltransferase